MRFEFELYWKQKLIYSDSCHSLTYVIYVYM